MPPTADHDEAPPTSEERWAAACDGDPPTQARIAALEQENRTLREALSRKEAERAACEARYRLLFDHLIGAYVLCQMFYDEAGNIGRRYRRQDEVGTPFCITYDFDSETDGQVTVRERDSMTQERIPVEGLRAHLQDRLEASR